MRNIFTSNKQVDLSEWGNDYPRLESGRLQFQFQEFYMYSDKYFSTAYEEIEEGMKLGQWIWYIFPQLASLGYSNKSAYLGLRSIPEAIKFLDDKKLGKRLVKISRAASESMDDCNNIIRLMGSVSDANHLLSCATLFYYASRNTKHFELFKKLKKQCEEQLGNQDMRTLEFCEKSYHYLHPEMGGLMITMEERDELDEEIDDYDDRLFYREQSVSYSHHEHNEYSQNDQLENENDNTTVLSRHSSHDLDYNNIYETEDHFIDDTFQGGVSKHSLHSIDYKDVYRTASRENFNSEQIDHEESMKRIPSLDFDFNQVYEGEDEFVDDVMNVESPHSRKSNQSFDFQEVYEESDSPALTTSSSKKISWKV